MISVTNLNGFDDPRADSASWNALLTRGGTNSVFQTWEWKKAWWDSFERTGLLLFAVAREGELIAIAPFFAEEGLVYCVGAGGSDYLDFIGDITVPEVLYALLLRARESVTDFVGFRFYHVPDQSPTRELLRAAALRLGLIFRDEAEQSAPATQLGRDAAADCALVQKKSLLRHENYFRRSGSLKVHHFSAANEIEPQLDAFFEQHTDRWHAAGQRSLFRDGRERRFYRAVTTLGSSAGWLRFTRLDADERPIAFHFGFSYNRTFMWYKPTFDIALARHSPGEVLLRQLLLRAMEEGAQTFDFGLGDESFKQRFATHARTVRNFGVYRADAPLPEIW